MATSCLEIELPSRTDLVTVVRMLVANAAQSSGALSGDRIDDLKWVVSEAVTNAINANAVRGEDRRVMVKACFDTGVVELTVADEGPGIQQSAPVPAMEDPARLEIEGGFGIPLMESLASSPLRFRSEGGGTTVEIRMEQR